MTRAVLGTDVQRGGPLVERASLLLTRGRRLGTKESYAGKWHRFVVFCTETLPEVYGWKPRCPLPATERTVILYLSHLSMEGLVKERSLNSYLAAINQAHEDIRLPRPALGQGLRLTRSGLRDVEGEEFDDVDDCSVRAPVPAAVIMAILKLGLQTQHSDTLRKCACVVLNYCWYNRADTGMQLKRAHLSFDWRGVTINARGKTVARNAACPVTRLARTAYDPQQLIFSLLRRWHATSAAWQTADSFYWTLPGEASALHSKPAAIVGTWLNDLLALVDIRPPVGEKWSAHSLRSGGASASLAIGVTLFFIMKYGVWRSLAAVQQYLSHLVVACPAAYVFFGWMLPPTPPPRHGSASPVVASSPFALAQPAQHATRATPASPRNSRNT